MTLKNIDFGPVWGQSGIQGFFGEGNEYPHHKWYKLLFGFFGFSFKGMTFVAKTTSLYPRLKEDGQSNTDLKDGYKLKEWFPKSIWFSLKSIWQGYILNAMGIPTPGLKFLLETGKWQQRKEPFQISFNPFSKNEDKSIETQIKETSMFCDSLCFKLDPCVHTYGIQINVSCPNTGNEQKKSLENWKKMAKVFREEMPDTPIIFKLDLTIDPEIVSELQKYCDAIVISNTLAFGKFPEKVPWYNLFNKGLSPIAKIFGENFKGGLSGKPLYPLLFEWIVKMENIDPTVKIIAGGGIDSKNKILELSKFDCVHGIALGSVAIYRPWRLQGLISYANQIFSNKIN